MAMCLQASCYHASMNHCIHIHEPYEMLHQFEIAEYVLIYHVNTQALDQTAIPLEILCFFVVDFEHSVPSVC